MRLPTLTFTFTFIALFATYASSSVLSPAHALQPRSDPGGPCKTDAGCYGGANCCNLICKLGSCTGKPGSEGGPCAKDGDCSGGGKCCDLICTLGSCRMDGSCDADNDCYGWCHNNSAGKCCVKKGKKEGLCSCEGLCT
ncbi:hypothetical protein K505DRAFT_47371 [Melanomma pulvis-pyrius CBS 109.77]|uniref:WAP domain-containing protein n=1 Tax=Melanomma pulvis-pyrius CBS 109.77 TaxID=1314802 RepID=A0A6A6XTM7_9PLEO|nr:hypothetical protein K505DRAFT_47371 [Melanomma pulvis-pyrius CBS 109.77]